MEASRYGVRSLSLVAIVTIMLLGGVAEADEDTCVTECTHDCVVWCPLCTDTCYQACSSSCKDAISFLHNTGLEPEQMNAVHYCKLGCATSLCSAITTTLRLHSSTGHVGENAVEESVERCNNACSDVCIKRFSAAVVTA